MFNVARLLDELVEQFVAFRIYRVHGQYFSYIMAPCTGTFQRSRLLDFLNWRELIRQLISVFTSVSRVGVCCTRMMEQNQNSDVQNVQVKWES